MPRFPRANELERIGRGGSAAVEYPREYASVRRFLQGAARSFAEFVDSVPTGVYLSLSPIPSGRPRSVSRIHLLINAGRKDQVRITVFVIRTWEVSIESCYMRVTEN